MRLIVLHRTTTDSASEVLGSAVLVDAAGTRGVETRIVTASDVTDEALAAIDVGDVVLLRTAVRDDADLERITGMLWALELRGVTCFPSAEGLVASEDKLRTFVRLRRAEIPTPSTVAMFVSGQRPADVALLHEQLRAFPVVVKRPVDWDGRATLKCDDGPSLRAALEREQAERPEGAVLLQPFYPHDRSLTVRVAAGRARSASAALPQPGEFRTSRDLRTAADESDLDAKTTRNAVAAIAACALRFGTVDFLEGALGIRTVVDIDAMPRLRPDDPQDRAFAAAIVACALGDA